MEECLSDSWSFSGFSREDVENSAPVKLVVKKVNMPKGKAPEKMKVCTKPLGSKRKKANVFLEQPFTEFDVNKLSHKGIES